MNSSKKIKEKYIETDIIVIGGGGTGFAAAVSGAELGANVVLLEKRSSPGGTSVFANGLFGAESPVQKRMGVAAMKDDAFKIAMDYSHWEINPRIFRAFIEKSGDTIGWLEKKGLRFGAIFSMYPGIDALTYHSLGPLRKTGPTIIKTLRKECEERGVRIFLDSPATNIIKGENGQVTGALVKMADNECRIKAKSIILATGGYSGNRELLKKYYPLYNENMVFLGAPSTGDGLKMAIEAGAATEGLGGMLLHPHYYKGPVRVDAIAQEPCTMWVNKKGERFTDETITFRATECGNAVNRQLDKCTYVLLDKSIKERIEREGFLRGGVHGVDEITGAAMSELHEVLVKETGKGDVKISNSWGDIAEWIGVFPNVLNETVSEYNRFCTQGYDEVFNKERRYLQTLQEPPYYAIKCFVSCLDTIGGIKINQHMEVLNNQDDPIQGLFAGGDAVGGWEADTYCILLPGSAFGFALNSGRIAGENAFKYVSGRHS